MPPGQHRKKEKEMKEKKNSYRSIQRMRVIVCLNEKKKKKKTLGLALGNDESIGISCVWSRGMFSSLSI